MIRLEQYNQSNAINNMVRAIKAMRLTKRPEQYKQSNMVSNTIRTNPEVVILSVAPTQRPKTQEKAWYLGDWYRKINSQATADNIY